jgi:hypothetical protein
MDQHELGRYTGRLVLHPLPDGRKMRVLEDFGFLDSDRLHWAVPPGTTVDGASIPQPLWSLIGGPFEGKYRDASVVHDYYCSVRSADWKSVHRVFYRAMLVSGVSVRRAKLMYAAVYFAGPRWGDMDTENVLLGPPVAPKPLIEDNRMFRVMIDPVVEAVGHAIELDGQSALAFIGQTTDNADSRSDVSLHLDTLSEFVDKDDPSLRLLEDTIDKVVSFIPGSNKLHREISTGALTNLD